MARILVLLVAFLLSPIAASAVSLSSVGSVDCADSVRVSFSDTASSFNCSGNFLLSGGSIFSDFGIVITSSGSLSLDNLSITAPFVELSAGNGVLSIGNGVSINTNSFLSSLGYGAITGLTLSPSASITVGAGDAVRVLSYADLVQSINPGPGAITSLVGGEIVLISAVPEPSTYILMLLGLLAVFGMAKNGKVGRYA
jgi:PEP-CTERM motif